jgi:gliding motility-associated-like protein
MADCERFFFPIRRRGGDIQKHGSVLREIDIYSFAMMGRCDPADPVTMLMKATIPITILALLVFAHCKTRDEDPAPTPYNMQCPARPTYLSFPGAALPNGFTPNGDGRNDKLRLLSHDSIAFKSLTLKIIDSDGKLLISITDVYKGWDGINPSTGKAYPHGVYRIEYSGVIKRGGTVADSSVAGNNCIWLFTTYSTTPRCLQAPPDPSLLNDIKFEDQFDPVDLLTPYTSGENFCL